MKKIPIILAFFTFSAFAESDGFKLGFRIASSLSLLGVELPNEEGIDGDRNSISGFSLGLVGIVPFSNMFSLSLGADLLMRNTFTHYGDYGGSPDDEEKETLLDLCVTIPALLRVSPISSSRFYVDAGLQTEYTFGGTQEAYEMMKRNNLNFGIVLGVAFGIAYDAILDAKYIIGLSDYSSVNSKVWGSLDQISVGVTKMF
jgi:hypothetical protein